MGLELNKVTQYVGQLGEVAAQRLAEIAERMPQATQSLNSISGDDALLLEKIRRAQTHRWAGAIPTQEPPAVAIQPPPHPKRINIIAADGSQIYPDRHGVALFYLINIGSIVFKHGSSEAPLWRTKPELFFDDNELYYAEEASPINSEMVNTMRDVREMRELAELASAQATADPVLTILDNGLLMFLGLRESHGKFSDDMLIQYLGHLDELHEAGALLAGVVDRPRAANVVRLLSVAEMDLTEITKDRVRVLGQYAGITDAALFEFLKPGERSALFVNAAPENDDYVPGKFKNKHDHTVSFFYMNAGTVSQREMLRVEVPRWVANDANKLGMVHAAIWEQCQVTQGFPYVLMRAHEIAVVNTAERNEFEQMVIGSLIRQGIPPSVSRKALGKQWTSAPKGKYRR